MKGQFTKYEKARIVGARALQIAMGAPILLKLKKAEYAELNFNPINIAKREFQKGVLPLTIKENLPDKKVIR